MGLNKYLTPVYLRPCSRGRPEIYKSHTLGIKIISLKSIPTHIVPPAHQHIRCHWWSSFHNCQINCNAGPNIIALWYNSHQSVTVWWTKDGRYIHTSACASIEQLEEPNFCQTFATSSTWMLHLGQIQEMAYGKYGSIHFENYQQRHWSLCDDVTNDTLWQFSQLAHLSESEYGSSRTHNNCHPEFLRKKTNTNTWHQQLVWSHNNLITSVYHLTLGKYELQERLFKS